MTTKKNSLHPFVRLAFLVATCLIILFTNLTGLLIMYLTLLCIIICLKLTSFHAKMLILGIVPIFMSYILIYIVVLGQYQNWNNIITEVTKTMVFSTAIQIVLLVPANELIYSLKKYGIKDKFSIPIVASYSIYQDIINRADKIVSSRFSRGYITKRTRLKTIIQLPFILVPLFIQIFRSLSERSQSWEQKNIIELIKNYDNTINYNKQFNIFLLLGYMIGFFFAIINH